MPTTWGPAPDGEEDLGVGWRQRDDAARPRHLGHFAAQVILQRHRENGCGSGCGRYGGCRCRKGIGGRLDGRGRGPAPWGLGRPAATRRPPRACSPARVTSQDCSKQHDGELRARHNFLLGSWCSRTCGRVNKSSTANGRAMETPPSFRRGVLGRENLASITHPFPRRVSRNLDTGGLSGFSGRDRSYSCGTAPDSNRLSPIARRTSERPAYLRPSLYSIVESVCNTASKACQMATKQTPTDAGRAETLLQQLDDRPQQIRLRSARQRSGRRALWPRRR